MSMFAVLSGQRKVISEFSDAPISVVELNQIVFNEFAGFVSIKEQDLNLISVSELGCGFKYLEGIECLDTETGLSNNVVLKLVPLESVKEKFDHYRYLNISTCGILKAGKNYLNKDCKVKFEMYQQLYTDWLNLINCTKMLFNVSEVIADKVGLLSESHYVLFNDPYNNDYKIGNRIYENTMYDLKTGTVFYKLGCNEVYKFERFVGEEEIECTVFNEGQFVETCTLNLGSILSGIVKLGLCFEVKK